MAYKRIQGSINEWEIVAYLERYRKCNYVYILLLNVMAVYITSRFFSQNKYKFYRYTTIIYFLKINIVIIYSVNFCKSLHQS
jgi:hypothetical protein